MSFWSLFNLLKNMSLARPSRDSHTFAFVPMDSGDGTTGLVLHGYYMPEELLRIILSFVDAKSLLQCRRVCKYWRSEVDNEVWKYKVRREQCLSLSAVNAIAKSIPNSWLEFYAITTNNPFGRNLLKNNCGQANLKYWEVLSNGGDRWIIENPPVGTDNVPDKANEIKKNYCFATSYHSCSKRQLVTLEKEGLSSRLMDELQPNIQVSEWYAGRFDCGSVYEMKVELLSDTNQVIAEFEHRVTINPGEGTQWSKVSHEFSNYGTGVRSVSFYHGGTDTQFWAGHYGSKLTGGCIKIQPCTEPTVNTAKTTIGVPESESPNDV